MPCMNPFIIKDENKCEIPCPCGKCPFCIKRRTSQWSWRLMQQEKISETAYFITFTYATECVPITDTGLLNLRKQDVQLFFKRVRDAHNKYYVKNNYPQWHKDRATAISYYLAGEYGTKFARPHYHAIIFNSLLELMLSNSDLIAIQNTDFDGQTEVHIKQWPHGYVTIGRVNEASVGYTLKYLEKPKTAGWKKGDDRQKEFSLMSKGIGKSYITAETKKYHMQSLTDLYHITLRDGKKIAMPRYIKEKLYDKEQLSIIKGHWKGEMEKKKYQELEYCKKNSIEFKRFFDDKKEAASAAYRAMYQNSKILKSTF